MPSIQEWKSLLDDEPDNELIRFSYAKALLDAQQFSEAVPEFRRLVQDNADYALAWAFLARSSLLAGDLPGARLACEQGMPVAKRQRHEIPESEIQAVLDELDSDF